MLMAGCHGGATPPQNATQDRPTVSSISSSLHRPSQATTTTPSTSPFDASPFGSVSSYLSGRGGEVTAAAYDAQTGKTWTFDPEDGPQDTASIVKVEIMGAALEEAQTANEALPKSEASLMLSMIENSDNDSATTLLRDVGGPSALAKFDRMAGMTDTTPSTLAFIPGTTLPGWGLTTTTAADEVMLISKFAFSNQVLSASSRAFGLSLMENVEADQNWGVSGGVSPDAVIALKNGWLPLSPSDWQVNSIGWISGDGRNYVLAVLTTGDPTEAYGIATIEGISHMVFAALG
jgi:hypothetical protein